MTRQKGRLRITIIVTVISPEASPGETQCSFLTCMPTGIEGSLLTDVLCGPRSTTDKVRAIISPGLITRD